MKAFNQINYALQTFLGFQPFIQNLGQYLIQGQNKAIFGKIILVIKLLFLNFKMQYQNC